MKGNKQPRNNLSVRLTTEELDLLNSLPNPKGIPKYMLFRRDFLIYHKNEFITMHGEATYNEFLQKFNKTSTEIKKEREKERIELAEKKRAKEELKKLELELKKRELDIRETNTGIRKEDHEVENELDKKIRERQEKNVLLYQLKNDLNDIKKFPMESDERWKLIDQITSLEQELHV